MNSDHKLIRGFIRSSLQAKQLNNSKAANQLYLSPHTIGRWLDGTVCMRAPDADDLMSLVGLEQVTLRQPYDVNLPIRRQLAAVRKQLGVSVAEISAAVGTSVSSFYGWEQGINRGASLDVLEQWARFLGMGGLTIAGVENPSRIRVELIQNPAPYQVEIMLTNHCYWGHRYVPFSLEHAALRVEAYHKGVRDEQFVQIGMYQGNDLTLAKFRPALLKLAIRLGTVDRAAAELKRRLERHGQGQTVPEASVSY